MADDTKPSSTPSDAPETKPEPKPEPSYITRGEFTQFSTSMREMAETVQIGIAALQNQQVSNAARFAEPAPAVSTDDADDLTIDNAVIEGKPIAQTLRRAMAAAGAKIKKELQTESIQPIQDVGLPALAEQAFAIARPQMVHYERYKKEIDAAMRELPISLKARPSIVKSTYDLIIGSHHEELAKEREDEAIRKFREDPKLAPGGAGREVKPSGSAADLPDDKALFGEDALASLRLIQGGRSIEDIAKRLGYASGDDYRKARLDYLKSRGAA